ncbi:MAG: aminopeptidase P family N-terminal domain-containing protein, partial [Thermodesulfovibrionales bacterium]|nr:aminopeptidase P family N-terminal domain-containing protein [Thermodesulfovibrionales bacterium]
MDHHARVLRLRRKLKGLDAILVTDPKNVRYLTGFTGSAGYVLIRPEGDLFITDFRYREQSSLEVTGMEVLIEARGMVDALGALLEGKKKKKIGIEPSMTFAQYSELKEAGLSPVSMDDAIERMRMLKDKDELLRIKEAVRRAEDAFGHIKPHIR